MNNQLTRTLSTQICNRYCSAHYKRLLLCILFCISLAGQGLFAKPFLYEVKHPNKPGTLYLIGSVHALHSYDSLPPEFDAIFPHSDKVYFEANLDDSQQTKILRSRAYLPPGQSLQNFLTPGTYQELSGYLSSKGYTQIKIGRDAPVHFNQLRPWVAFTLVSQLKLGDHGLSGDYGVDRILLSRSRTARKPVQFLESVEFQMQTLESAITGSEEAAIGSALHDNPDEIVTLWKAGDAAGLHARIVSSYASAPTASAILYEQRNRNWLPVLDAELAQNKRTLVVVGAGHLLGNVGLLRLLRDLGCSTERLPAAPRVIRQPTSQDTTLASTVTLTTKALGTPPLTYQWRKGGISIPGATSTAIVLTNIQLSAATNYSVTVANLIGSTSSSNALIRVFDPNQFTSVFVRSQDRKLGLWLFDGTNAVATAQVRSGTPFGLGWKPVGVADFDNDTHADLLFQHEDGRLAAWLMQGTALRQAVALKTINPVWRALALGDFDNNNKTDIVFRHTDGRMAVWFMNGTSFESSSLLNNGQPVGSNWTLISAAHFDNDAHQDLVWQNTAGTLAVWRMEGTSVLSKMFLRDGIPVVARAVSAVDWNRNGETDLLFQKNTGQMSLWFMEDTTLTSASPLQNPRPLPHPWKAFATR